MAVDNSKKLILALNAGSSSLKASLMDGNTFQEIFNFLAERLNTPSGVVHLPAGDNGNDKKKSIEEANMSHETALKHVIDYLHDQGMLDDLVAIGHRVVHGGTTFPGSVIVHDEQLQGIKDICHLAPLHNPHNVAGMETMRKLVPSIPNVAVFDTSFHSTIPPVAHTYPLPHEYRDHQMRKFGFHGTSVHYVTLEATKHLATIQQKPNYNMIVCHLGNGASVTAVSNGQSKDTTMGFTPLSGLMMGTRCGSIDPSLIEYACQTLGKTVQEVTHDMNKNSGLKAMSCNGDSDMRAIEQEASEGNTLAMDMFVYRLSQHIASSIIALDGPLDALVFTAGIGEHSVAIRERTCQQLKRTGLLANLQLDALRNLNHGKESNGVLTQDGSWPVVLVVPTDEEKMIAKECLRLVGGGDA